MRVVTWDAGRVSTRASVALAAPLTGAALRDAYVDAVRVLTFGLVRVRHNSLVAGPVELLRLAAPRVTRNAVEWPIEGGLLAGRPRRGRTLAIAIAYHVACWSTSGRTLGGVVMRQRVVSVDGLRLTPTQSLLRLALLPVSLLMHKPLHDELASTEVIRD